MARNRRYTDEQFIEAVKSSTSYRQVLHKLGLVEAGGNYKHAKLRVENLKLDASHFTGMGHLKGKINPWHPEIPLKKVMVKGSTYTNTHRLKKRLIKSGHFEEKCYRCNNSIWQGEKIPLELEHKNGDNRDHRQCNLTLLCPNCHALTPTYRGKNRK